MEKKLSAFTTREHSVFVSTRLEDYYPRQMELLTFSELM